MTHCLFSTIVLLILGATLAVPLGTSAQETMLPVTPDPALCTATPLTPDELVAAVTAGAPPASRTSTVSAVGPTAAVVGRSVTTKPATVVVAPPGSAGDGRMRDRYRIRAPSTMHAMPTAYRGRGRR